MNRARSSFVIAPSITICSPAVSAIGASDPCWAAHVNNFVRFSHVISIVTPAVSAVQPIQHQARRELDVSQGASTCPATRLSLSTHRSILFYELDNLQSVSFRPVPVLPRLARLLVCPGHSSTSQPCLRRGIPLGHPSTPPSDG